MATESVRMWLDATNFDAAIWAALAGNFAEMMNERFLRRA